MNRFRLIPACLMLATFLVAWLVVTPALADGAVALSRTTPNTSSAIGYTAAFNPSFASFAPPAPPAPIDRDSKGDRAPLCDHRGAITFASAPQMQDLEVSLEASLTPDECLGNDAPAARGDRHRAAPGRGPLPTDASSASTDAAILASAVALAALARELTPAPGPSTPCSRPGHRSTVDRPPRV